MKNEAQDEPKPENILRSESSYSLTLNDQISSLKAYKDFLLVGLKSGTVKKYKVTTKWSKGINNWQVTWEDQKTDFEIRENNLYAEKIEVDESANLAFVMDNSQKKIYVLSLKNLRLISGFNDGKKSQFKDGVIEFSGQKIVNFCLDQNQMDKHRIAIQLSKEKSVVVYTYAQPNNEHIYSMYQDPEYPIDGVSPDATALFLCGDYLTYHVGDSSEATVLSIGGKKKEKVLTKQNKTFIWPEIKTKSPSILFIRKSPKESQKFVCLLKYSNKTEVVNLDNHQGLTTLYFHKDSSSDMKKKLSDSTFSGEPEPLGFAMSFPYVGAVIKDSSTQQTSLEFRCLFASRDEKNKTNPMSVEPPVITQFKDIRLLVGSIERFYAANTTTIYPIIPPTYLGLRQMLSNENSQDHITFLKIMKGKDEDILGESVDKARGCLKQGQFSLALGLLVSARNEQRKKKGETSKINISVDARALIARFSRFTDPDATTGLQTIQDTSTVRNTYLLVPLDLLKGDNTDPELIKAIETPIPLVSEIKPPNPNTSGDVYKNILLYKAENMLIRYLETIRPYNDGDIGEQRVIDYCLISLYLQRIKSDLTAYEKIVNILKGPNSCSVDKDNYGEFFTQLLKNEKRFLALLYVSKGKYDEALKTLSQLLKSTDRKQEDTETEILSEIVEILKTQSDWDNVIKPYAKVVLDIDSSKGVEIFTSKRRECSFRPKVINEFLSNYPTDVSQKYLQYLIEEEKNDSKKFHTLYAKYLIKNLQTLIPQNTELGLYVRIPAGKEPGLVGAYRTSLLKHLETLHYNKEEVLKLLEETTLFVEQSILYKINGQPEKGIEVLLTRLRDPKLAEQYCDDLHKKTTNYDDPSSIFNFNKYFLYYIKVCFARYNKQGIDGTDEQLVNWGLQLLRYRGREIDPTEAFRLIDRETPISKLEQYLKETMNHIQEKLVQSELMNKISESANLDIHHRREVVNQRSIDINLQTVCSYCKGPIGDSVVSVFPDLSIVHYRCLRSLKDNKGRDRHIHPTTGQDFKKYPTIIDFTKKSQ